MSVDAVRTAQGAQLLPPAARQALMRAAATPITPGDVLARVRAINMVIERARAQFPEYFRKD